MSTKSVYLKYFVEITKSLNLFQNYCFHQLKYDRGKPMSNYIREIVEHVNLSWSWIGIFDGQNVEQRAPPACVTSRGGSSGQKLH